MTKWNGASIFNLEGALRNKFFRASTLMLIWELKPGFHIVVSVVSVVRKKFIGQIQLYGNLPYKCSIQQKRQIQLVVRDRMNSICPMNFFRRTDTTDTTIWKPGINSNCVLGISFLSPMCSELEVTQPWRCVCMSYKRPAILKRQFLFCSIDSSLAELLHLATEKTCTIYGTYRAQPYV